jgi:hypothetical protein
LTPFPVQINVSCKIKALQGKNVDRPESDNSNTAKSCVFIAHENLQVVLYLFSHFLTQSAQRTASKILQDIFQLISSLYFSLLTSKYFESPSSEFKLLKYRSFKGNHSDFNCLNFGSWSGRFKIFLKLIEFRLVNKCLGEIFYAVLLGRLCEKWEINAESPAHFHAQ